MKIEKNCVATPQGKLKKKVRRNVRRAGKKCETLVGKVVL